MPHCDSLWCLITHPQTPPVGSEVERLRAVIAEVREHTETTLERWTYSQGVVSLLDTLNTIQAILDAFTAADAAAKQVGL